jgi:tetratricopeptide (TPR) repeat protein
LAVAWLAGLAVGGAARAAAPLAQIQADRAALVQGLQAQFEVALIRERKLADDRELRLVGALEARLKQARADVDAAKGDARAAQAQLVAARSDYAELADQLSARDTSARAEIAAHRAQAQAIADEASPALAAALQRFADGDRLGAWPTIEDLTNAAGLAKGATDASRAAGLRRLAELRDIMRKHGEAGASYVMALKGKAAGPDPSEFDAFIARAKLAHDQGDLSRARAAAEQALAVAATDREHATALKLIGEQAADQLDTQVAWADYDQALVIFERLASADPTESIQTDLASVLHDRGDLLVIMGDFTAAHDVFEQSLAIHQRLSEANPSSTWIQEAISADQLDLGALAFERNDMNAAISAYRKSLEFSRRLAKADPANADYQHFILRASTRLARMPGGGVGWAEVAAQYDLMKQAGQLTSADQVVLDALKEHGLGVGR